MSPRAEQLFAQWVERLIVHDERLDPGQLCGDDPEILSELLGFIHELDALDRVLDPPEPEAAEPLPSLPGFRTIERLGRGGSGDVYKLEDLQLGRIVAAKVLRPDSPLRKGPGDVLDEARCLALFADPRIVRVIDIRREADPPHLLMEHVDGFTLDEIGPSLGHHRRARLVADIADAVAHAHRLGVLHHDLKPANILVDASLSPRILDFGLAGTGPEAGRAVGTLAYMAPERLDRDTPIDTRSDVYSLGVILYELLCGALPFAGDSDQELIRAIRHDEPRLPVEVEPSTPEPLQAIALKAMERAANDRYASTQELAQDLRRFASGQPVLARPTLYQSALGRRLQPHLEQIREWLRLRLIHPHEADSLRAVYARLEARDDDWIVHGRALSMSRVTLYLGAFLLVCGGLLHFVAYHWDAFAGPLRPLLMLGLPFAALSVSAGALLARERRAVAIAFHLAAVAVLPLLVLVITAELGWWPPGHSGSAELFVSGWVSNRQLQVAAAISCAWACWLALSTRTSALASACTALLAALHIGLLADLGLRTWLDEGQWHVLGLHLLPLVVVVAALGWSLERADRGSFAQPMYLAGALLVVVITELVALDGRAMELLGLSMGRLQNADVSDPKLLDTLTAMTAGGVLFYLLAWLLDRRGTPLQKLPAHLLFSVSPFATLEPIFYLNSAREYSRRFLWVYLVLALAITLASHLRQRRSFYYAGLVNTGGALWLITDRYEWLDRPAWAAVVVVVGLATLAVGYGLDSRERSRPDRRL